MSSFSFGKNFSDLVPLINSENANNAKSWLVNLLELPDFKDKTFIDVGCGSGIFSYAACLLNAKKIVSIDSDPVSIECCSKLREKAGSPAGWEIRQLSILDANQISGLPKFDIVFSWGVLHHTGRMWEAMKNCAGLVAKNGKFFIAIYNKAGGPFGSNTWRLIKKTSNAFPWVQRFVFEPLYAAAYFLSRLFRHPPKSRHYKYSETGEAWKVIMRDRLGGYPYECATTEEVFTFIKQNFPDFVLVNLRSTNWLWNNLFVFVRK